jgi:signal transduction histidine kinase
VPSPAIPRGRQRHVSARRLLAGGLIVAVLAGLAGGAFEWWRFGASDARASARVETHVRGEFDRMARVLDTVAAGIVNDPATATGLAAGAAGARDLFDLVDRHTRDLGESSEEVAVTIFDGTEARAWAGRPSDVAPVDRLTGTAPFFVTPSPLGLRLVQVRPLAGPAGDRRGTVAVEHVLSRSSAAATIRGTNWELSTPLGPASLRTRWEGAGDKPPANAFVLHAPSGEPLVEATVAPQALARARAETRRRVAAAVITAIAITVLLLIGPLLDRRAVVASAAPFVRATIGALLLLVLGAAGMWAALTMAAGRRPSLVATLLIWSAAAAAAAALLSAPAVRMRLAWRSRRVAVDRARITFTLAQLAAGLVVAGVIVLFEQLLSIAVSRTSVDLRHFSLYPWSGTRLMLLSGLVASHAAALWTGTLVLSAALARWRLRRGDVGSRAALALLWLAPSATVAALAQARAWGIPAAGLLISAAACVAAALFARRLVSWYRRTTVAARILALFLAFVVPALLLYPSIEFFGGRALRRVISQQYAVEALNHPQDLQLRLAESLQEIDRLAGLPELVTSGGEPGPGGLRTEPAFYVWRDTALARARLTSAVELYDEKDVLVSRFALNFPEYTGSALAPPAGSTCEWDTFAEVSPFGSDERNMLHAQRSLCGPAEAGRPPRQVGTIVVHVVLDYRTLPFISSQSPYFEVFRPAGTVSGDTTAGSDVETVIYGWGLGPLYMSGRVAWPINDDLFARLYASREPFWTELPHGDDRYRVYFSNDRTGIFALGYRAPTLFDDLVHLAELTTLSGALYAVVLFGTALFTRVSRERPRVGRALLREIRASFYRKLFLAFVLASIIPVLTLAVVIRAYFKTLLLIDIEAEAARTAAVAQRVIEETQALARRDMGDLGPVSDDVLIWISQVIDQDVNIFRGPQLLASSELDLFASGLLPTRTPADVYRSIVLQRLPSFVGEDRIGTFPYMIAAAPVRVGGSDAVLTVPLANRQREIEREIDDLDRGVHLAALFFILLGAGIGVSMAERIADPVKRLTRATRRIARGEFDEQIAVKSTDELRRLVDAFNRMAAELKAQRAQLERTHRLEAWAEMARQVAHEIKNPLTPIQLSAEHLRRVHEDRGEPMGPVLESCVSSILGQVRLLRQISAEFSSFASSPTARPAAVDVPELVADVVDPYRTGLAGRIEIANHVAAPLPRAFVDRTLVARALANIVENALHAMPGAGRLTLDAQTADGFVTLAVHDTGVGMDEEALERVFEPYFSTKTTGTGLGLPIARRNIELNGGRVEVASAKGMGTTVTVYLPLAT